MQQLTNRPGKEDGATLIVALVMLILISLIGAASLRGATVAEKMAAADHQKNITFQASESAANVALRDQTFITDTIIANAPNTRADLDIGSPDITTMVTFTPLGKGPILNASIGSGGFSGKRIMVTSSARMIGQDAETRTVHGVVRLLPGGS